MSEDLKSSVAREMARVAALLAQELGIETARVKIRRPLSMPPYLPEEAKWQPYVRKAGVTIHLDAVNCPTLWQVEVASYDESALRVARFVKTALRAVAWQLDQGESRGLIISGGSFSLGLGGVTAAASGRFRLGSIDDGVNASSPPLNRFIYTVAVTLPAIDIEPDGA